MNVPRASLGNLREFVNASFPEPHNPIMALVPNYDPKPGSVGDFVWATFPEPHNPISGMGGCAEINQALKETLGPGTKADELGQKVREWDQKFKQAMREIAKEDTQ